MRLTSRLLKRNRVVAERSPYYALVNHELPCTDPCDPSWQWPRWVRTPFLFGRYVHQLHTSRKLDMKFPEAAFRRFAAKYSWTGYERLTRAAAKAAYVCGHSFSPRFVKNFLEEVPSREVVKQRLY